MTQFFMGVKPGVGPVLKILKYDTDDPLTLANDQYSSYFFNSESQNLGYIYSSMENIWSSAVESNPEVYFIEGNQNTAKINVRQVYYGGGINSLYIDVVYRINNIYPQLQYPLMCEYRNKNSSGRYACGKSNQNYVSGTWTSTSFFQFDYYAINVKQIINNYPNSPANGIITHSSTLDKENVGVKVGETIIRHNYLNMRNNSYTDLISLWSLPGHTDQMPTYNNAPNKEALRLSKDGFKLSRPGYDVDSTSFGSMIIDSDNAPALCVMSGEILNIASGASRVIPAPTGVTLAPTAVCDFIYNRASDDFYSVPSKQPDDTGAFVNFNVSYSVQPNSITLHNDSSIAIRIRYVVFNSDLRPKSSGGSQIMLNGNGYVQIKKPGSSDVSPIPSDILLDTRYPTIQILKEGYLPRSSFSDVGRNSSEHVVMGRYKSVVTFNASGLLPFVKYTRVFPSAYASPYFEKGRINAGGYNTTATPNGKSSLCRLYGNEASFYLNWGEWDRFYLDAGTWKFRTDLENDPIGIRYYILGIPTT